MNFENELAERLDRSQMMTLVDYVGDNSDRFEPLFEIFCFGPTRLAQRASWVVSNCVEKWPSLIEGKFEVLLKQIEEPTHAAIKRNAVRLLQFIDIPNEWQGQIYQKCFDLAHSPKEAIAVRSFSLQVLFQIARDQPFLLEELEELLHDCARSDSAGIISRVKNLRMKIAKINNR